MSIRQTEFGTLPDGRKVDLFSFESDKGVKLAVINYGGIVQSLTTPDRDGRPGEIVLGFDALDGYVAKPNCYGALIGRVANRIAGGRFTLEGLDYQLNVDGAGHSLHGGAEGFNRKLWDADIDGERLRLDYVSNDGEEHYPGTLAASVWYSLVGNDLKIDYEAKTDQTTIVNLTNHSFFNLNCCARDILAHEARLQAERYTPVDASLIPTGEIAPVAGTPMDFRKAKPIGRDLEDVPGGYDHNFVFSRINPGLEDWLAEIYDPDSGRVLKMATTEPCAQFYGGNFLDGSDIGHGGVVHKKHFGVCLEAQRHPDAINHPNFDSIVLDPGETYSQTTIYRFEAR
ncbi:MAG: galactose mutarotase [Planctomycetota bacterium]|jgi:aldose 1-epimerase|nr:galactose mutarotase [Planctomycetota bacterium]